MDEGLRFAIREGGRTVGAGVVTKSHRIAGRGDDYMAGQIRIRLKAFDYVVLDQAAATSSARSRRRGAVLGPIPLPTKTSRWTVLKSPHVDKKSREQFELKTHKRLIEIIDSRAQTVDALTKLDLPAGVDVEIKVE